MAAPWFARLFGRARSARPSRSPRSARPSLERLESRLAPARVTDSGARLIITLDGTGEGLNLASGGTFYGFASTRPFTNGGVANPGDFQGFGTGGLFLLSTGLARYSTIEIADSANGTSVSFVDSGGNAYPDNFVVNLDNGLSLVQFTGVTSFGGNSLTARSDRSIVVSSTITATSGNITLEANQQALGTIGSFRGLQVLGAITTTGSGSITLRGEGGTAAGNSAHIGVDIFNATVSATGGGSITIVGQGGSGADSHFGVEVRGATARVSSTSGAINITGTGGRGTGFQLGVFVHDGAQVNATGSAPITITGTGGNGTQQSRGITIQTAAQVSSVNGAITLNGTGGMGTDGVHTGVFLGYARVTATGAAPINFTGTGGSGGGSSSQGIILDSGSLVTAAGGALTLTGTGGSGTGGFQVGVQLNNASRVANTGIGAVTIVGVGGTGTTLNMGVGIESGSRVTTVDGALSVRGTGGTGTAFLIGIRLFTTGAVAATGVGAVTVEGTGGSGGGSDGVRLENVGSQITSVNGALSVTGATSSTSARAINLLAGGIATTGTGSIALIGDTMDLGGPVNAEGNLVRLRQKNNGTPINLGGGDGAQLGLTDAELDNVTADTLVIGDGNSGRITVAAPIDFTAPGVIPRVELRTAADVFDGNAAGTDLRAVSLLVRAGGGIGAGNPLELAATTINAETTSGAVELANTSSAPVRVSSLRTGSGPIIYTQLGGGTLGLDSVVATNGSITLRNTGGHMTLTSVQAGGADQDVRADTINAGDVIVGAVSAADDVTLNAAGSVFDDANNTTRISGDLIDLTAVLDVGGSGDLGQIDTAANSWRLTAAGAGGVHGIWVSDVDAVAASGATTTDGLIALTSGGTMTLGSLTAGGVGRTVALTSGGAITDGNGTGTNVKAAALALRAATGIGSGDALEIDVPDVAASNTASGNVELIALGPLNVAVVAPVLGTTVTGISNANGDVSLRAGGALTQGAGAVIVGGGLKLQAPAAITLNEVGNNVAVIAATTAATISYRDADGFEVQQGFGDVSAGADIALTTGPRGLFALAGAAVRTDAGSVTISADDMHIAGAINATTGVTLRQAGTANPVRITLGGLLFGSLELGDDELDRVTAPTLTIGRQDNAGDIAFQGSITRAGSGYDTLILAAGGFIIDFNEVGLDLDVADLALLANRGIGSADPLDVRVSGNLAFRNSTVLGVGIAAAGGLTIGAVGTLATSENRGTTTTLSSTGPLTFAANVTSTGSLTATAGDTTAVNADHLTVKVGAVVRSTGGDVNLRGGDDLTIEVAGDRMGSVVSTSGRITLEVDFANADAGVGGTANVPGPTLDAPGGIIVRGNTDADTFNLTPSKTRAIAVEGNAPTTVPGDTLNLDLTGVTGLSLRPTDRFAATFTLPALANVSYTGVETVNTPGAVYDLIVDLAQARLDGVAFANGNAARDSLRASVDAGGVRLVLQAGRDGGVPTDYFGGGKTFIRSLSLLGSTDVTDFALVESVGGVPAFAGSAPTTIDGTPTGAHSNAAALPPGTFTISNVSTHVKGGGGDTLTVVLATATPVDYFADRTQAGSGNVHVRDAALWSFTGMAEVTFLGGGGPLTVDATLTPVTTLVVGNDSVPFNGRSRISGDGAFTAARFSRFATVVVRAGTGAQRVVLEALDAADTALTQLTLSGDNAFGNDSGADVFDVTTVAARLMVTVHGGAGSDTLNLTLTDMAALLRLTERFAGTFALPNFATVNYTSIETINTPAGAYDLVLDLAQARLDGVAFANGNAARDSLRASVDAGGVRLVLQASRDGGVPTDYFGGGKASIRSLSLLGSSDATDFTLAESAGGLPAFAGSAPTTIDGNPTGAHSNAAALPPGTFTPGNVSTHVKGGGGDTLSVQLVSATPIDYFADRVQAGSGNVHVRGAALWSFTGLAGLSLLGAGGALTADATLTPATTLTVGDDGVAGNGRSRISADGAFTAATFGGFAAVVARAGTGAQTVTLAALDRSDAALTQLTLSGDNAFGLDRGADTFDVTPPAVALTVLGGAGGDTLNLNLAGVAAPLLRLTERFAGTFTLPGFGGLRYTSVEAVNGRNGRYDMVLDLRQATLDGQAFADGNAAADGVRTVFDDDGATRLLAHRNGGMIGDYFLGAQSGIDSLTLLGSTDVTDWVFAEGKGVPGFAGQVPTTLNGAPTGAHSNAAALPPGTYGVSNLSVHVQGGGADPLTVEMETERSLDYFADQLAAGSGNLHVAGSALWSFQGMAGLTFRGKGGRVTADASLVGTTVVSVGDDTPSNGLSLIFPNAGLLPVRFGGFAGATVRGGTGAQTMVLGATDAQDAALTDVTLSGDNVQGNDAAADVFHVVTRSPQRRATLQGGGGDDSFFLLPTRVDVQGGTGSNRLVVDATTLPAVNVIMTATRIAGGGDFDVTYSAAAGGFGRGVQLALGAGNDNVSVWGTAGPTWLLTGAGNDAVSVAALTGGLATTLTGVLGLDAGPGVNILGIAEASSAVGTVLNVSAFAFTGSGFQVGYTASGGTFSLIAFTGGQGSDVIRYFGKLPGSLVLDGGGGNDSFAVRMIAAIAPTGLQIDGGAGVNAMTVTDGSGGTFLRDVKTGVGQGVIQVRHGFGPVLGYTYQRITQVNDLSGKGYIQALFRHVVGRPATVAEESRYLGVLASQGRLAVALAVENSVEGRYFLVRRWFLLFLGRAPVGSEAAPFVQSLLQGHSEEAVLGRLVGSASAPHTAALRTAMVNYHYLDLLRRRPTAQELAVWVHSVHALVGIRLHLEIGEEFFRTGI